MGEYVSTSIKLGGKLKASEVGTLIELLNIYNFASDDTIGDAGPNPTNLDHEFRAQEVNYGQIDDLVTFCRDQGLDYEHWVDACAGCDPSITRRVGGVAESLDWADGNVVVPLSKVLEIETLATGMADLIALAKRWATPLKLEIVP